jgi:hypothetical protein
METKDDDKKEPEAVQDDKTVDVFDSFNDILEAPDTEYKTVVAWGKKHVRLGSLTAGQMIEFLESNDDPAKKRTNGLLLITQSLVDKVGKRLCRQDDAEIVKQNIEALKKKDANVNAHVVEEILKLNGLNRKDAKEIAKNVSGEARTGASPTTLH